MKKDDGLIHKILSATLILFIMVCYLFVFETRKVSYMKSQLEDALVQANMAAAIVDIYQYGTRDEVIFLDTEDSYDLAKGFLEEELDVEVHLLDFRLYEVREVEVVEYIFDEEGVLSVRQHPSVEGIETPNGSKIETSTVYSKIGVEFEVFHTLPIYIEMEQSVDIARNL